MNLTKRIAVDESTHKELAKFADAHNLTQNDAIRYLLGHVNETHKEILKEVINYLTPYWKKILSMLPKKDRQDVLEFLGE